MALLSPRRSLAPRWRLPLVALGFIGLSLFSSLWATMAAGGVLAAGAMLSRRRTHLGQALLALGLGAALGVVREGLFDFGPPLISTLPRAPWVRLEGEVVSSRPLEASETAVAIDLLVRRVSGIRNAGVRGRLLRLFIWEARSGWQIGDRMRLATQLKAISGLCNDGADPQGSRLKHRGVVAVAAVGDDRSISRLDANGAGWLLRWRGRINRALGEAVPGRAGGLLQALIVGDRSQVGARTREVFMRAGATHMLSVSGLHLMLVFVAVRMTLVPLLARSRVLVTLRPAPELGAVLGWMIATLYGALAGGEIATQRAVWMLSAAVGGILLRRPSAFEPAVALASLVLLFAEPDLLFDVAFQLTFVAVVAVIWASTLLAGSRRQRRAWALRGWLREALGVSLAVTLVTAPIVLHHFGTVSVIGPVVELVVTPWLTWLALLPGLTGTALESVRGGAGWPLFMLAGWALQILLASLDRLADLPGILWQGHLSGSLACGSVLVALGFLAPGEVARRGCLGLGLACALVGLMSSPPVFSKSLEAAFLDVGQGAAAALRFPGKEVLLIDAGPAWPSGDAGQRTIIPSLATKGWQPSSLVLTHADLDHTGGASSVLAALPIRELVGPRLSSVGLRMEELHKQARAGGAVSRVLSAGATLVEDAEGSTVQILHPPDRIHALGENDASLVALVRFGAIRLLFPGDVERAGEIHLAGRRELGKGVLIVAVPHHGSRTSSQPAFVARSAPALAVVSAARSNRWEMPAVEVVERWRAGGAKVLTTGNEGEVRIVSDGQLFAADTCRPEVFSNARRAGVG